MRKKDLIQISITGVLVIVLILVWASALKKPRLPRRDSGGVLSGTAASLANAISRVGSSGDDNLYDLLEQKSKSIELKRDPFTAAAIISEKSLNSDISLTGILWDKIKPLAIIDGNVVKKGQRMGDKVVVDIKADRVILSDGQILSEIRLQQ